MKKYNKKIKVKEAKNWIPSMLNPQESKTSRNLVSKVSMEIDYNIDEAYAFCVSLLEDVNAHTQARQVNDILYKDMMTW